MVHYRHGLLSSVTSLISITIIVAALRTDLTTLDGPGKGGAYA